MKLDLLLAVTLYLLTLAACAHTQTGPCAGLTGGVRETCLTEVGE